MDAKVRLDTDGYIDEDVDCSQCGYNLRGIVPSGVCPECGTPAAKAFNALQFADPVWVNGLAGGLNWMIFSMVWSVVFGLFSGLLEIASFGGGGDTHFVRGMILALPMLGWGWGVWKFTMPEPSGTDERAATRYLARYCSLAAGILSIVVSFSFSSEVSQTRISPPTQIGRSFYYHVEQKDLYSNPISGLAMSASMPLGVIGLITGCLYARRLAYRIPDKKLARNISIALWGSLATVLLLVLMIVLAFVAVASINQNTAGATALAVALPGCGAVIGVLIFSIWSLIILSQYRKKLKAVAARASMRTAMSQFSQH